MTHDALVVTGRFDIGTFVFSLAKYQAKATHLPVIHNLNRQN